MPSTFEWVIAFILPGIVTLISFNGAVTYFHLWVMYMFLDATYGHLFHMILLVPARRIASVLPGSRVPPLHDEKILTEQEEQTNDPAIIWPSPGDIAKLPNDWIVPGSNVKKDDDILETHANGNSTNNPKPKPAHSSSNKKKRALKTKRNTLPSSSPSNTKNGETVHESKTNKRSNGISKPKPYYLNHVRGSTRIRQASQRIGAAMGTLFSTYLLCSSSLTSLVNLDDIGIGIPSLKSFLVDVTLGIMVGSSIVILIFILEVKMGWIKILDGYCITVVPNEVFAINFTWDVLFHVGVSINEELMLRGWMFILGCRGLLLCAIDWFDDPSNAATFAIIMSTILQSTLFSLLHFSSPGSTWVSLLNLFLGGIAASLNVMVAGGTLWLGIGWHFGWNIFMGHILGRSTSGIPMSCKVFNVIPRPKATYEKFHGGTFGPELGVLAPLAYVVGMILVLSLYGFNGLESWKDNLVAGLRP